MNKPSNELTYKVNNGKIISVRGSVVDVFFENDLPQINSLLHTGKDKNVAIEVLTQLDDHKVRGIALSPTQAGKRSFSG
ncbi:MAG: hypothetical protein H7211_07055 [Aquabacterium sp.]|nr:hypothetical protein [Ferruginibacter sp.]